MSTEPGRWLVHGERFTYESDWMSMALIDVETPSGARFEHHAVRFPRQAVGVIVRRDDHVLMIYRHRFITDSWGWEIPAGCVDDGETLVEAAHRECVEETGWAPGPLEPLITWHPSTGALDQTFHAFRATSAERLGDPTDTDEAVRVEWLPLADVAALARRGELGDGLSVTALLAELAGL